MTYENFIKTLSNYYFDYDKEFVKNSIYAYVKSEYKEEDLSKLYCLIQKNFSRQYRISPDIANIENIVDKWNKENDYPGDRIERKNDIMYIKDDPKYSYLFENKNKQIESKNE
jgi:hypothetical protein